MLMAEQPGQNPRCLRHPSRARFRRLLPSQMTTDKSVQTLDDLVDNKVIRLLPIDRNDCLTVERGEARVMATLAVPALIQNENVFLHWTFLILRAGNCPDLHQRKIAAIGMGTVLR